MVEWTPEMRAAQAEKTKAAWTPERRAAHAEMSRRMHQKWRERAEAEAATRSLTKSKRPVSETLGDTLEPALTDKKP